MVPPRDTGRKGAQTVEEFLAEGGVIEQLGHGERGQPLTKSAKQHSADAWNRAEARKQAHS